MCVRHEGDRLNYDFSLEALQVQAARLLDAAFEERISWCCFRRSAIDARSRFYLQIRDIYDYQADMLIVAAKFS